MWEIPNERTGDCDSTPGVDKMFIWISRDRVKCVVRLVLSYENAFWKRVRGGDTYFEHVGADNVYGRGVGYIDCSPLEDVCEFSRYETLRFFRSTPVLPWICTEMEVGRLQWQRDWARRV